MWKANIACIVTLTNLLAGFFAIILYLMGKPEWAMYALICAFFGDGIDGAVARHTKMASAFGERLDSLSDLVCFGVAPIMFALNVRPTWEVGLLFVIGLYLVCGAVRLARYDPMQQVLYFKGMPIPIAGLTLAAFSMTSSYPSTAQPWFNLAPGLLGLLMISDIPFRKVSFRGSNALIPLVLGLLSLSVLVAWRDPAFATLAFTVPYLVINLLVAVGRDVQGRVRAIQARSARSVAK